jgi:hypothetical protein
LINELYKPNPAQTVSHIQEVLQRLQKSPQGWQLAQGLLARPGDNIKFFGALTIIVKLNTEKYESSQISLKLTNSLVIGYPTTTLILCFKTSSPGSFILSVMDQAPSSLGSFAPLS